VFSDNAGALWESDREWPWPW